MVEPQEPLNEAVVRLPLPLPLRDLPTVNCYAVRSGDELTLIDPGWKSPATDAALTAHLAALDATPHDVRRILVTHSHWDHYTQALDWQERYGTEVLLGRGEVHSIEALDLRRGPYPQQVDMLRRSGAPELAAVVDQLPLEEFEQDMPFRAPTRWLDDGEVVAGVTARSTPGHTRGHTVYEYGDIAFTGDHVLPRITPSLGFEQAPEAGPLASYLSSLRLLLDGPDRRLAPAHGAVTDSVHDRVAELLTHHDRRLEVVRGHLLAGATTAFEVATRMRWTRRERRLGDLGEVHAMSAVLEVRTHLEQLVSEGRAHTARGTIDVYAAA